MGSDAHRGIRNPDPTQAYFDVESDGWSERYGNRHFRDRLNISLDWLPRDPEGLRILDYGCGSGVLSAALVERGCRVTGVDPSAGMIRAAASYLAGQCPGADERYRLERITGTDSPDEAFREDRYDGIYSLGVLEYVADDVEVLGRLLSLLTPGGFLVLSLPNARSVLRRFEGFVFRHPGWLFRWMNRLDHITGPNSYLRHQQHQYRLTELDDLLHGRNAKRTAVRYHVAPALMRMERRSWVGMTMMVRYEMMP